MFPNFDNERVIYQLFILHVLDSISGNWSAYSTFSTSCGGSTITRTRDYGGGYCSGPSNEYETCNGIDFPGVFVLNYTNSYSKSHYRSYHSDTSSNVLKATKELSFVV